MQKKKKLQTFTEILLMIYSISYCIVGIMLIFFTEEVSVISFKGENSAIINILQQFFGSITLLSGLMMFNIRKLKGKVITNIAVSLIVSYFIILYLLLSLNEYISLPIVYFILLITTQLSFFIILYEQLKRR